MIEFRSITPVLTAGLALLGGCAQLEWYRADVTAEVRARDIADCEAQAHSEALHMPALHSPAPHIIIDNSGRTVAIHSPHQNNERFLAEHDLMRTCMRTRGYVLQNRATVKL